MERTRAWYAAQGFEKAYAWASFETVPFTELRKPLCDSTVAIVATATPLGSDGAPVLPKRVYSGPIATPPGLYTDDLAWDKEATHTDDPASFLPIRALGELAAEGRIAALADRFHGVPTEYSQRRTQEIDAPEILRRCREDAVDLAVLVPL